MSNSFIPVSPKKPEAGELFKLAPVLRRANARDRLCRVLMIIRPEQMNVFSEHMLERFVSRMIPHLRSRYPEKTTKKDDKEMRGFVKAGIAEAHSLKIYKENNLVFYLECTVLYGAGFCFTPQYDWAGKILQDPALNETEKMNQVSEYQIFTEEFGANRE